MILSVVHTVPLSLLLNDHVLMSSFMPGFQFSGRLRLKMKLFQVFAYSSLTSLDEASVCSCLMESCDAELQRQKRIMSAGRPLRGRIHRVCESRPVTQNRDRVHEVGALMLERWSFPHLNPASQTRHTVLESQSRFHFLPCDGSCEFGHSDSI